MSTSQTMIDIPTVTSGRFLTLPPTAKVLYFYLLMYADDDGIVDAYVPLKISHTQLSDLTELEQKGYIIFLENQHLDFCQTIFVITAIWISGVKRTVSTCHF